VHKCDNDGPAAGVLLWTVAFHFPRIKTGYFYQSKTGWRRPLPRELGRAVNRDLNGTLFR